MGEWQRGENNSQYGKKLSPSILPKCSQPLPKSVKRKAIHAKAVLSRMSTKPICHRQLKGRKQSPEEIEHRRQKLLGQKRTDATKAKLRAKALEQFARQGNPMQGRKHSAETKEKIAATRRGKPSP